MSTARRAYDLLRGYVNREYDRIRGVELSDAERELNDAFRASATPTRPVGMESPAPAGSGSREDRARAILGVGADAPFDMIRRAFERLNKRSDPANFPAASIEREHAAAIQKSVQWAYSVLTVNVDTIEKRFRSLEID